ncbi:hypothetical protein RND81_06G064900 [Saponaria officinalis]|uniref:Fe2OG dioxygenase domain-containing protein n=1 Tax=Saponaria officinalis TaxID=3572 RepID=A0AAW1K9R8_SAPOF
MNHGVPIKLMNKAMEVFDEFFHLTPEEKEDFPLKSDIKNVCRLYTSTYNYDVEEFHNWRDALRAECTPLEECMEFWPQKPENFKEVIGEFVRSVKNLSSRMLERISEGLGLEPGYLGGELSNDVAFTVNHYPPCPDPSLTIGLQEHTDATVITIIHSGNVPGFQFVKDGQWHSIETPPDTLLVFMGSQIEVISNGMLKGVQHRVASNKEGRYSVVFFVYPTQECIVEPAKAILQANGSPTHYRSFQYKDFFKAYAGPKPKGMQVDDVVQELVINP